MRVLLVHNRYRIPGGEERHVALLERWLRAAGVDVRLFEVSSPSRPTLAHRVRLGATLTYRRRGADLLRAELLANEPDVVHFHNIVPLLTPAALRAARQYGACVALTVHNYRFACPSGMLLRRGQIHEDCIEGSSLMCGLHNSRGAWAESITYGWAIEMQRRLRMLHRWVDAYIAPCSFVAEVLGRAGYPRDRIHTIYHATPMDDTVATGGRFGMYVGRLSQEKGIQTLLAASRIAAEVPLVVAGHGPLAELVRNAGTATRQVSYVGQLEANAVAELRREALFTVAPSEWYEVQPLAVLESMAAGKPVIASRLGGLSEIVEDRVTGMLVRPGDSQALGSAMSEMWTNRTGAAEMGLQAQRYAASHFSPAKQTARLIALYDDLLERRNADSVSRRPLG